MAQLEDWSRDRWVRHADGMLAAVLPFTSPGGALVTLPGAEGGYGRAIDGLEGFARTFLLAGFRLAGEHGDDPHGYAERFARGLATGTDPSSGEHWQRLSEHGQAKVEAASVALILDATRPWIWDRLTPQVQEQVVDYLAEAVGDDTYPRTNWVWFRLVVQTFLRSVGGPHSLDEMREDLDVHDSFVRADGWLADGVERSFDHYNGWALHLYPTLWARMAGTAELAAPRRAQDVARLDRFLDDALALIGADGSPLVQGRSLTYRFAAAAPFWVGAMAEVPTHSPGRLRHAASAVVGHFAAHGAPDDDGLLTLGWHHAWPQIAQSYSGPGSPYWASKGMLGLALPADHPVWTAPAEPLPVEQGDLLRTISAPGWVVSGTRADGIVRIVNHGTDHAVAGAQVGDSPLYARFGYSTATSPWLDDASWDSPAEQSVALIDAAGRATHRAGFEMLHAPTLQDTGSTGPVGTASSRAHVRWLDPDPDQTGHGSGRHGATTPAGTITTVSLVRGPWEVRCVRVEQVPDGAAPVALRVTGWPTVTGDGLVSRLEPLAGTWTAGTESRPGASPLGDGAHVDRLDAPVETGRWLAVLVAVHGGDRTPSEPATFLLDGTDAVVRWPDGVTTTTPLG